MTLINSPIANALKEYLRKDVVTKSINRKKGRAKNEPILLHESK